MDELKKIFQEYYTLNDIAGILFWDNATYLPQNSSQSRSEQLAVLSKLTDKTLRNNNLDSIIANIDINNLSKYDKKNFVLMREIISQENSVDPLLKEKLIRKKIQCEQAWRIAKEKNDISIVKEAFDDVLSLTIEESKQLSLKSGKSPYDSLIGKYDIDLSSSEIDRLFSVIQQTIIPTYLEADKITNARLPEINIDNSVLLENMKYFMTALKFDFKRGRIDLSNHPFCGGANDDIRITTRFEKNIFESISALFHESGHGLYEQNRPKDNLYQPIGQSRSLTFHESQSLFFENHIFKSINFFKLLTKNFSNKSNLLEIFKENYHSIKINPIRVSSDEFSYPIHIYIRYEIEKIIFSEKLDLMDIREIWNKMYKEMLGISITNDREGVLQDIHWFEGVYGYFPTYATGAMMASQLKYNYSKYDEFISNPNEKNMGEISQWLIDNIHQHGSKHSMAEILNRISKEELNPNYLVKHLEERFKV
jgi:carboxypeptidase Taq